MKRGNLNFLEPSGPLQACNGTALPSATTTLTQATPGAWGSVVVKALRYSSDGPRGVTGFFSDIFPSNRTMDLGSTQPLVKMSTRNIPGSKGSRCMRLTTSPHSRVECHKIWKSKPPGTLWATPGLLRDSFPFYN
jgi:hypothetical protein